MTISWENLTGRSNGPQAIIGDQPGTKELVPGITECGATMQAAEHYEHGAMALIGEADSLAAEASDSAWEGEA